LQTGRPGPDRADPRSAAIHSSRDRLGGTEGNKILTSATGGVLARRQAVPGAGLRGMLLGASIGGGLALAFALLSTITGWHTAHLR
jgi:hypothetical protein